jgi:hypothetical protein
MRKVGGQDAREPTIKNRQSPAVRSAPNDFTRSASREALVLDRRQSQGTATVRRYLYRPVPPDLQNSPVEVQVSLVPSAVSRD